MKKQPLGCFQTADKFKESEFAYRFNFFADKLKKQPSGCFFFDLRFNSPFFHHWIQRHPKFRMPILDGR